MVDCTDEDTIHCLLVSRLPLCMDCDTLTKSIFEKNIYNYLERYVRYEEVY